MGFRAYQQYRHVNTSAFDVTAQGDPDDAGIEVAVSRDEDGGLTATVSVWNVSSFKWTDLVEGDAFMVELGYRDELVRPVINGEVEEKKPTETEGSDTAYTFVGKDASEKRINNTYRSKTWEDDPTLEFLVRDLAELADLRPGRIVAPTDAIGRSWCISDRASLADAYDRLTEAAADVEGEKYEWYASRGQVNFVPKADTGEAEINQLTDGREGNLISSVPAEGKEKKSGGGDNVEIEALLDPQIEKDALAPIRSEAANGAYRVANYSLSSSTENGDHEMTAELVPTNGEYEIASGQRGQTTVTPY